MYTIRYSTEDYRGRPYFSCYIEDTITDARKTFRNVCSSLRSDWFNSTYRKIYVSLMSEDLLLDEYSLDDANRVNE